MDVENDYKTGITMRIVLITINTPASENLGGTSALPYHLLVKRPADVEVVVFSFNYNNLKAEKIVEVEKELDVKINLLSKSNKVMKMLNSKVGFVQRMIARYPLHYYTRLTDEDVLRIKEEEPDGIWIYGEELSQVSKQFAEYKRVHCFPDSEALYYKRMMEQPFVRASKLMWLRQWLMYPKFARMERNMDNSENIHYYLVGQADADNFSHLNPKAQAHFIRHPHYDVVDFNFNANFNSNVNFDFGGNQKIKLLIAGRYDLYMKYDADLMVGAMVKRADLQKHYVITILGKGWDSIVVKLRNAGYEVNHITFAEDYIEEIRKHDIQLTPISIGTGTKGKVLDALSNGLLVIGTWFALENIAVENGKSCIEYHSADELMDVLAYIPMNREKYRAMAEAGRNAVLTEHAREKCSKEMFDLLR